MNEKELREYLMALRKRIPETVIREDRPTKSDLHPTMKPIALVERMIEWSSSKGQIVLDLFGGSGSTMIAAEKCGRHSRLMELDPRFVDVIVKRWQEFTGKQAKHENGKTFEELQSERSRKK
jgi:DNA modification methylase